MSESKKCSMCKRRKTLAKFDKDSSSQDGVHHRCNECTKAYKKRTLHRLGTRYSSYKDSAKRRKFAFDLTIEQFDAITAEQCYYCGGFSGEYESHKFNGVDRLTSDEGYFEHNCVPCCATCNSMKSTQDSEDFVEHVEKIHEHYNSS